MKDHSLPSKKLEPKYKYTERKTYVICYPMAMCYAHHELVGLVTCHRPVNFAEKKTVQLIFPSIVGKKNRGLFPLTYFSLDIDEKKYPGWNLYSVY